MSCESLSEEYLQNIQDTTWSQQQLSTNRFIYMKQQYITETSSRNSVNGTQTVLVNPHFKKKVFVNPNFAGVHPNKIHVNPHIKNINIPILSSEQCINREIQQQSVPLQSTKIHINPNARSVQIPLNISHAATQTVHINPNFKNPSGPSNISLYNTMNLPHSEKKENFSSSQLNEAILLTRTKLIRIPDINKKIKRRNSVKSKYKIVKSSYSSPKKTAIVKNNKEENKSKNKYKIDHRRKSLSAIAKNQRKYVYINRFLSVSDLAKTRIIKSSPASPGKNASVVNIRGVLYRKSRTSLRRASVTSLSLKKSPSRTVQVSKFKLVKSPVMRKAATLKTSLQNKHKVGDNTDLVLQKFKIVRKWNPKKNKAAKVSKKCLRKCNIPCPYYKKYGLCKGKENGKCFRKHDPDQIALCTRFLQGACIKDKCLLSHNVSSEKMPTCKYYLEGSCSREGCPYLHVKINPKAEVCRDFLEGFCKKAAECDKRHQYLCPDYEKYGNCVKQRCPYPHGKMVRKYVSNKTKFAKKCSDLDIKGTKSDQKVTRPKDSCYKSVDTIVSKIEQVKENQRYYDEKESETKYCTSEPGTSVENTLENPKNETNKSTTKNFIGLRSRPKLGTLPAFIPFGQ